MYTSSVINSVLTDYIQRSLYGHNIAVQGHNNQREHNPPPLKISYSIWISVKATPLFQKCLQLSPERLTVNDPSGCWLGGRDYPFSWDFFFLLLFAAARRDNTSSNLWRGAGADTVLTCCDSHFCKGKGSCHSRPSATFTKSSLLEPNFCAISALCACLSDSVQISQTDRENGKMKGA